MHAKFIADTMSFSIASRAMQLTTLIDKKNYDFNRHYSINRNRNLQTSKAPLKSQAKGTSLFTSAASSQRGFIVVIL